MFCADVMSIQAMSVLKKNIFCDVGGNFYGHVDRTEASVHISRCTLSSFFRVDISGWFAEEFRKFAVILLCSGVSWMLVEVDVQNVRGGISVVMSFDRAKWFTIADLAHWHSLAMVWQISWSKLSWSFVLFRCFGTHIIPPGGLWEDSELCWRRLEMLTLTDKRTQPPPGKDTKNASLYNPEQNIKQQKVSAFGLGRKRGNMV